MKADGHQIGSHTWSHQRLTTVDKSRVRQQMVYNEIAFADLLGEFPTYMRPPYSASDGNVDELLGELGYHVTYFNLDTEGYLHEDDIEISQDIAEKAFYGKDPETDSYLQIEHDTVAESVHTLIPYLIDLIYDAGFEAVTVGECLGDPEENWYRGPDEDFEKRMLERGQDSISAENFPIKTKNPLHFLDKFRFRIPKPPYTPTNISFPTNGSHSAINASLPLIRPAPTTDGRCGRSYGNTTCMNQKIENCCSKSGWCGATQDHCMDGCQEGFGRCGMFGHSSGSV